MTADRAAHFQRWHEEMTDCWTDFHAVLSSLENERDAALADIQRQYEKMVADTWAGFRQRAGEQMDLLAEQTGDLQDQRQAQQLPYPAGTPILDGHDGTVDGDALTRQLQRDQAAAARPPWDPAVAPPAPPAAPPGAATGDTGAAPLP